MPVEPDDRDPADPLAAADEAREAALPEPVRDHLGQQLRGVFATGEGVPDYLGEPVVPDVFVPQIRRLEVRLKTHEEGTEAVAQALDQILGDLGATPPAEIPNR